MLKMEETGEAAATARPRSEDRDRITLVHLPFAQRTAMHHSERRHVHL